MAKKKIEEKYKELSERDHVLLRPGMWIGSIKEQEYSQFVFDSDENKMTMRDIYYAPGMLKLFDEILSNSCDEFRRKDNMGLTQIEVTIDKDKNQITVKDNGGIPIVQHKVAGCYVPEFIFGRLRTSSNYDDTEDRNVIGTNGVGSALTNVFSSKFEIQSCDGKKHLKVEWKNNMDVKSEPIIKDCKDHYTQTSFIIDFKRFDQNNEKGITNDFINILIKRCIDAAAANLGLKIIINVKSKEGNNITSKWKFKKFEEYMELYSDFIDLSTSISYKDNQKQIWICPDSQIDVAFVNGAECSKGTHLSAVRIPIGGAISEILKKKHKIDVTRKGIDGKYGIFGVFDISNPSYNSQTKEELTTSPENFYKDGSEFKITDDFLKKCQKSEIVDLVLDWYKKKCEAEDAAKIRKLNREAKKLLRSDKFINCTSKKNSEKELFIFEGDSAHTGFRMSRNPQTQASYRMRGVPLNCIGMTATQVMKNQVFNDLVNIIGLQWGEDNKKENLKFGKLIITSDADYDGDKICALLFVFFNHFPELFEQKMICRVITPIISATKGKDHKLYYTREDFAKDEKKLKGYVIKYLKGVGTQTNSDYKLMMQNPILHYYTKDDLAEMMLKKWFAKGDASTRKNMMKEDIEA
jgi:DNA topoisomerase-2